MRVNGSSQSDLVLLNRPTRWSCRRPMKDEVAVKLGGWLATASLVVRILKDDWMKVRKWSGEAEKFELIFD